MPLLRVIVNQRAIAMKGHSTFIKSCYQIIYCPVQDNIGVEVSYPSSETHHQIVLCLKEEVGVDGMPPRQQKEHVESISSYGFANIQAWYNLSYTVVSADVLQLQYESYGKYPFFSSSTIFSSGPVSKLVLYITETHTIPSLVTFRQDLSNYAKMPHSGQWGYL